MQAWLLMAVGAGFAALWMLNNLIKAITRAKKVGFFDLLLTFVTALLALAALIVNAQTEMPDTLISNAALLLAGAVAVISIVITLLEIFRPQRLKGSRGILGIFAGVWIALASFGVPFASALVDLRTDDPPAVASGSAPAVPVDPDSTAEIDPTAAAEDAARARFLDLYNQILSVVTGEIEIDEGVVLRALEAGTPLAQIVVDNGGDIERVIDGITLIMQAAIRDSENRGEINRLQAAIAVSQMENFVRIAVSSDINALGGRFGRPTPAPGEATDVSLSSLLTQAPDTPAAATASATPTVTPLPTDTLIPTATRTATSTRTPRPTETERPTRQGYATRTPTASATRVMPCVASVDYNLRLRAAPERIDAPDNTLLTIPFGVTVELYGKSEDGMWWLTFYDDTGGWVMGEFMTISAACARLPVVAE